MASRKDLLSKVYKMVPPMLESFHKGPQDMTLADLLPSADSIYVKVSLVVWPLLVAAKTTQAPHTSPQLPPQNSAPT